MLLDHVKCFLSDPSDYLQYRKKQKVVTDYERWSDQANLHENWNARTLEIAQMIAPHSKVLEFGAGNEVMGAALAEGCLYQPSDIVKRSDKTLVCDLNKELPALEMQYDVIVFSGVIEYIHNLPALMDYVRKNCSECLVSYSPNDLLSCYITRWKNGFVNHLSEKELLQIFTSAGFQVIEKRKWPSLNQVIYHLH